jgi:very-short-patch-repair endonuclease
MHIDIFLPGELVAIEIDGPSHFFPIYGEEVLKKKIEADQRKNDLLIGEGFTVIRVMVFKKNTQRASVRDCGAEILKLIKEISETPVLNANDRFFEVEVGDREIWRKTYGDRIDNIGQ